MPISGMLQHRLGVHHGALCGVHVHRAPGCTGFEHPSTTLGVWRPHSPFPIGGCIFKRPLGFDHLPPLDPKQGSTVLRTVTRPARSTSLTRCHADTYCNVDAHYRALYLIVILPIDKPGISLRSHGGIVLLQGAGEEGSSFKKKIFPPRFSSSKKRGIARSSSVARGHFGGAGGGWIPPSGSQRNWCALSPSPSLKNP